MILKIKEIYTVMAILELATNISNGPIILDKVSIKHNISLNYLAQIFSKLKKSDLVKSIIESKDC
ncbi:Iron-sulfur cluster assembly transcription factor IscR [Rickettsia prowazekii str. Rp22]|uniref:Rrf2 family transcriptional regulator n=2 Tax=Rickettsia prowazekii TaxID=782 RepID=Q9ZD58_RICPR|nr:Rrf2 family transcriptional regulator [Rickettsia prowazekii]ADE30018.1 Iron-sulfur cluster assembly transcription factor IscR [Rickettsia prowazekii str. Rp22]EOB10980.1 Iron-sulfur cluster assembly transcription factor IscR [Rickettsia prowazekii str. Cairo 3]CAA14941.1 unknown [Rickettsia prowazekii str. Madrid E]